MKEDTKTMTEVRRSSSNLSRSWSPPQLGLLPLFYCLICSWAMTLQKHHPRLNPATNLKASGTAQHFDLLPQSFRSLEEDAMGLFCPTAHLDLDHTTGNATFNHSLLCGLAGHLWPRGFSKH